MRRAVEHVRVMGDTDIFPRLPEAEMFVDRIDEVVKTVSKMQAGQYQATSSVEMLTPKSELGFRITNQLTASDNLIYTAAVLENAEGIEKYRQENSGIQLFLTVMILPAKLGFSKRDAVTMIGLRTYRALAWGIALFRRLDQSSKRT